MTAAHNQQQQRTPAGAEPVDGSGEVDAALAEPAAPNVDGRNLRRSNNRTAVIVALLDLIREGNLDPGAAVVAERAGVSHRSVFRYFDDLDDLVRAAIDHEFRVAGKLALIHDIGCGTLAERIERLIDSRIGLYSYVNGAMMVARMKAGSIPPIDHEIAAATELTHRQLGRHFAPELAERPERERDFIVDGCLSLTSFDAFDLHRRILNHSEERTRESWRVTLGSLLKY